MLYNSFNLDMWIISPVVCNQKFISTENDHSTNWHDHSMKFLKIRRASHDILYEFSNGRSLKDLNLGSKFSDAWRCLITRIVQYVLDICCDIHREENIFSYHQCAVLKYSGGGVAVCAELIFMSPTKVF